MVMKLEDLMRVNVAKTRALIKDLEQTEYGLNNLDSHNEKQEFWIRRQNYMLDEYSSMIGQIDLINLYKEVNYGNKE